MRRRAPVSLSLSSSVGRSDLSDDPFLLRQRIAEGNSDSFNLRWIQLQGLPENTPDM